MSSKMQENILENLPIAILGIPFSNFNLAEIVAQCIEKIEDNKQTGKISHLSTINSFLVTQCYGWLPTSVDHPELLSVFRHAAISTLSGNFLKQIAKLLASTVAPSYTLTEFFFALCRVLGEKEKGIFLLGGAEKEIKNVAVSLHDKFPKLRLVGIATPLVFMEGEDLIHAKERDSLLIEQINSSNADVLIINLGSPKQELWFERVRPHLLVPLVIFVDQVLSDLAKTSFQVSSEKEKTPNGFYREWKKGEKLKAIAHFFKLLGMASPLILYHNLNRFLYRIAYERKESKTPFYNSYLFLSSQHSIAVMVLPSVMNPSNIRILKQRFEDAASHDVLVFDFLHVRHIQPEGFYFLITAWLLRYKQKKQIYAIGVSADIKWLMKLHHTWDVFKHTTCDSVEALMSRLKALEYTTFYDNFTQSENLVTLRILGALDHHMDLDSYMKKIIPIIGQKNCCMNFSYCTFIDNTGFTFLLNLRKHLQVQQHKLTFTFVNRALFKQFKAAAVDRLFIFQ